MCTFTEEELAQLFAERIAYFGLAANQALDETPCRCGGPHWAHSRRFGCENPRCPCYRFVAAGGEQW
jgi:hypothetical protein